MDYLISCFAATTKMQIKENRKDEIEYEKIQHC